MVERLLYNPLVLIAGGVVALVWWAPQAVDLRSSSVGGSSTRRESGFTRLFAVTGSSPGRNEFVRRSRGR